MIKYLLFLGIFIPVTVLAQIDNNRGVIIKADSIKKNSGTTYAIVIGISKYKEVPALQFADRDAAVFADYLLNSKGMALDSSHVKVFLNERATLINIGNALSDIIIKDLKKGDKIIFFFAGHGDYDANILKDQALLLLYAAPKQNYFQNIFTGDFISTADLNTRFIEPLSNKGCDVLLFIDACHSTGLDKPLSGGTEGGKITMMALQNMTSAVKIYSCKANQYSLESEKWGGGRGLFSYVLMEALYGMADADNNKIVTLLELQRYLEDNIPKMASPSQQFPIVKIENADETVTTVNPEFLNLYKTNKNTNTTTNQPDTAKLNANPVVINIGQSSDKLYQLCDSLIKADDLEYAYQNFQSIAKSDTSKIVLQLKTSLVNALQQLANNLLAPLQSSIVSWDGAEKVIVKAEKNLEKAVTLIGEKNFQYKSLQAKRLFLKSQLTAIEIGPANDEAIQWLEQSLVLEPNTPYTYFYLARRYHKKNDLQNAKLNFDKYVDLIPNSAWAYNNRGLVYNDLKLYDEAAINFKQAIELNPAFEAAYNNAGNVSAVLKRFDEAINYYKKSIELKPDNALTYNNLGNAYSDLKNYEEAIINIKKALELKPDYPAAYINLGRAYLYLNKYEEAVINYKKALDLKPDNMVALSNLGTAYLFLKNYADAMIVYKKLLTLQPDCAECNYQLSGLYSLQNDSISGLTNLEQAFKKKYTNLKKIETDIKLNNIRATPEFKMMLEKYFTKAELEQVPKIFIKEGY